MTQPSAPPIRKQHALQRIAWEEIKEPGAYVEVATGALYRVPLETFAGGALPLVEKAGVDGPQPVRAGKKPPSHSQFVRVSGDPYIFSLGARLICVEHDIQPRF